MAHNGRLRSWVNREKWKCEIMPHEIIYPRGKRTNRYNYYSGVTKRIFDFVIKDLIESKIPKDQIPTIMSRSGLSIASIKRKLEGREETHLYELEPLLNATNFSLKFIESEGELFKVIKSSPNYTFKEELNRIIIKRNLYPRFYININPDNPIDLEIDFSKEKIIKKIGETKMLQFVMAGIETYFKIEKKPIRGIQKKIRTEIRRQFLNQEIIIKNK